MSQRFGPWDAAVDRELLAKIKDLIAEYRESEKDILFDPDCVIDDIAAAINEVEGTDL